jgi:IstB-like ATP binding protein
VANRSERFSAWGEIFGDATVAAALIDRLIHHAHMVTLKGKSYRLRERGTGAAPAFSLRASSAPPEPRHQAHVAHFSLPDPGALSGSC